MELFKEFSNMVVFGSTIGLVINLFKSLLNFDDSRVNL